MQTTLASTAPQFSRAGVVWLKLSVAYLIIGIGIGIAMGASQNFTLARLHFWLLNLALPVMMVALSEVVGALGIAAFAANLFINLKS